MIREHYFRGSFYPESCAEIRLLIEKFNSMLDDAIRDDKSFFEEIPRAIIAPHAGYIYSGFSANAAYRIFSSNKEIKRVFVFGPSHHHYFSGISGGEFESINLKNHTLECDLDYLDRLKKRHPIKFELDAHKEHSTETQFPFIKYYFEDVKVLEFVYGDTLVDTIEEILVDILQDRENGVVISSDLSHFYSEDEANAIDNICLGAIDSADKELLHMGCEACGKMGIEALIGAQKRVSLTSKIVDYRTSSWSSGDKSRVVGYCSAIYY